MNNKNDSIDIYEMFYNNILLSDNDDEWELIVSPETSLDVRKAMKNAFGIEPKDMNEIIFSRVTYDKFPYIDEEENKKITISCFIPVFTNTKAKGDPKEQMKRYKNFNVTKLPLLDVANYMNIKIEKSNQIDSYGKYKWSENKIVLASDYAPTFIHELAHAIDFFLPGCDYDEDYDFHEVVAELSTIVICKYYNIPIDVANSFYYIDGYDAPESKKEKTVKRIKEILEYIKQVKEYLNHRNTKN